MKNRYIFDSSDNIGFKSDLARYEISINMVGLH